MISQNITQVFTWKSESVRVKRGCKFWPWRPCLRAIFFQEKGTSYRPVPTKAKRSCLVVLKYYKKKSGKSRISAGEIPKLLRQDLVANPILDFPCNTVFQLCVTKSCRFCDSFAVFVLSKGMIIGSAITAPVSSLKAAISTQVVDEETLNSELWLNVRMLCHAKSQAVHNCRLQ